MSTTPEIPDTPHQAPGQQPLAETAVLPENLMAPQESASGPQQEGAQVSVAHTQVNPEMGERQGDTERQPDAPMTASNPGANPQGNPSGGQPQHRTMSPFIRASIVLLSVVSLAAIVLLFMGDFEGKAVRLISTVALFAVFTMLTAWDTGRTDKNTWYAPVALLGNSYILALCLIVTWITPYEPFFLLSIIFWKSLFVILIVRGVLFGVERLIRVTASIHPVLERFSVGTGALLTLSAVLFTLPMGIEAFPVRLTDLFWKFAVSVLILSALGLAITLLLRWYYTAEEREARRARNKADRARQVGAAPQQPRSFTQAPVSPQSAASTGPAANGTHPAHAAQAAAMTQVQPQPPQAATAPPATPLAAPTGVGATPPAQGELLPWPTFADGSPIPQLPNGQPDFSVFGPR